MVHENLDVRETAYTIVNEGRRLIGCDRVSVAIKRGRTCKVEAISGQDTIESRSNVVTALGMWRRGWSRRASRCGTTGANGDLPPQVEEALDAYVDESYAKNVIVLPLRKPSNPDEAAAGGRNAELIGERHVEREILGALIVEQIETDLPREILEPRIDLVYEHSTRALSNALDYHSVFLMPMWRAIGKSTVLVKGRNLPKTLTVGGAILAGLLALFLIRTDFDLKATGTLQPVTRRDVFFDNDGTIKQVLVQGDQLVKQDEPLLRLENHDLEQKWQEILGSDQRNRPSGSTACSKPRRNSRNLTDAQVAQISGEYVQLIERAKSLQEQLLLIEQKRKNLIVRSPIAGQVLLAVGCRAVADTSPGRDRTTRDDDRRPGQRLGTRTGHARTPHGTRQAGGRRVRSRLAGQLHFGRRPALAEIGTSERDLRHHPGQGGRWSHGQDDGRHRPGGPVQAQSRHDRHGESEMRTLFARLRVVPRSAGMGAETYSLLITSECVRHEYDVRNPGRGDAGRVAG